MSQSNICIRMDENLKKQFDYLCNELGLTMSTAINMFVKTVVRERRIPLDLSLNVPNAETQKVLDDVENGVGLSKVYTDVDEMFRDMDLEEDDD